MRRLPFQHKNYRQAWHIKRLPHPSRAFETSRHGRLPLAEILDNDVRTALSSQLPPADFVQAASRMRNHEILILSVAGPGPSILPC